MKVTIDTAFYLFQIEPEYRLYDKTDKENAIFHYQAKQYHISMYVKIKRTGKTRISLFYDTMPNNSYV